MRRFRVNKKKKTPAVLLTLIPDTSRPISIDRKKSDDFCSLDKIK